MLLSADICASENIFPSVILLLFTGSLDRGKSEKVTRLGLYYHVATHNMWAQMRYTTSVCVHRASGRIAYMDAICKRVRVMDAHTCIRKPPNPVGLSGKRIAVGKLCGLFVGCTFGFLYGCRLGCNTHSSVIHALSLSEDSRAEVSLL